MSENNNIKTKNYYSLRQVLESVSSVIKNAYKTPYWIKSEMVKLNHYPKSGHCYPDLVDKTDGVIKAQMRSTLWSRNYNEINNKFHSITGKHLGNDMNILFLAEVKFDAIYGFSLNIIDIDAEYELGVMAKAKSDCIARLKAEDIYNNNKKLKLPLLPQRIAIISDKTSKGYKDFISILNSDNRNYKYFHMLFPSLLQGDAAVNTMLKQLKIIKKVQQHFDLVAIIRGGGGDVGMDCYNNYELASEVANFPLPIISGIGHSTNETVVEMVAHTNSITPTDLAYLLQQKFDNNAVSIENFQSVIEGFSSDYINNKYNELNTSYNYVINKSKELFMTQNSVINSLKQTAIFSAKSILSSNNNSMIKLSGQSRFSIQRRLSIEEYKLEKSAKSIASISSNLLKTQIQKLNFVEQKIELVKPENLLKRGYSYNVINGKIVTDINSVKVGDSMITKTYDGELESEIIKINKYE